jgi:ankyrin repeat protein
MACLLMLAVLTSPIASAKRRDANGSLADAIAQGDHPAVLAALARGADPNIMPFGGIPGLSMLASSGDVDVIDAMLRAGADPNRCGDRNYCPLSMAAHKPSTTSDDVNQERIVALLMAAGANIDGDRSNPLAEAIGDDQLRVAELLLAAGANPNGIAQATSPFERAIETGNLAFAGHLLDVGAKPEFR